MTNEEKKNEIKNKISMTLKDPILQQGFEIICKNLTELEKENKQLKQQIEKECDFKQVHLSGLNVYEPKWHKVTDGDLPKEKKEYWCKIFHYKTQETFIVFLCFDPSTKEFKFLGNLEVDGFSVEEWCEIPKEVEE